MSNAPIILGIDENRDNQKAIANAFNERGIFYRFITERKKLIGGLKQINPSALFLVSDLSSDFAIQCIDTVSRDLAWASIPIIALSSNLHDAPFVFGFRTGVVGQLAGPFGATTVDDVLAILNQIGSRDGVVNGEGVGDELARLVEHLRRTRRSGMLRIFSGQPNEGRAIFGNGRLERARFADRSGPDALSALQQNSTPWTFSELAGSQGDGAGVVIEVGEPGGNETEVEVAGIVVEHTDLQNHFEVNSKSAPAGAAPNATVVSRAFTQPKILLVDDDEAILRMFSTLFIKRGFLVTTATDGRVGAAMTLDQNFDLIMTDLNMPHLDGWGMLRVLRDDLRTRELPVAFISAHDDYRESLKAVEAGAQAFLSKGTKLDAIVEQVRTLLRPRAEMVDALGSQQKFDVELHAVGPQWFLLQIAERKIDGLLKCKDGWSEFTLAFINGQCVHASAVAGKYTAQGDRALNALIVSRAATGQFLFGVSSSSHNLFHDTKTLIDRACETLNSNERKLRDHKLITGADFEVNQQLYDIYRQVGPQEWLPLAKMICEDKLSPRLIIEQLDVSPVDVEETLKDLVRRGVVVFKK